MKVKVGLIRKATCRPNCTYICCKATNSSEKYDVRVGLFGSSTFEVQFAACPNGDISYLFSRCASRITFGKIYIELRKTCFLAERITNIFTQELSPTKINIFSVFRGFSLRIELHSCVTCHTGSRLYGAPEEYMAYC
jgi:hypothetical protein